jgi:hypothetical protein
MFLFDHALWQWVRFLSFWGINNNPLLLLFKALLHGQKDRVFVSGHLIYILKQERLDWHGTFKSWALWNVRDSKGLTVSHCAKVKVDENNLLIFFCFFFFRVLGCHHITFHHHINCCICLIIVLPTYNMYVLTLSARHPFQNFSTPCILNVNNTGAKQRRIMK